MMRQQPALCIVHLLAIIVFLMTNISGQSTSIENSNYRKAPPPPPPVICTSYCAQPPQTKPHLMECDSLDNALAFECTKKILRDFVKQELIYPPEAKSSKTEGTVVIQFIVDSDGTMRDIKLLREIGNGCGDEALRIINLFSRQRKWSPSKTVKKGKQVPFILNMPVRFKL